MLKIGNDQRIPMKEVYDLFMGKLEPKDVEDMPCPVMPKLNRVEANELVCKLAELEMLSLTERTARIDELAARYFDLAEGVKPQPEEPSSSRQHQVRSRRPAGQHTRRAVPVP